MRQITGGLILILSALPATFVAAQPPAADTNRVAAQVSEWINALGAREFDTRDRAMQSLISAGSVAIEPILQVTQRRDQEMATRAVMVLKGIGERGGIDALDTALAALSRVVVSSGSSPIGQRATEARERLESIRQERAIDFFRSLGAEVNPEYSDTWTSTLPVSSMFSIEIGPGWKGTDKDLERLKWLRDAEQVCFVGPKVKDAWVQHLREMPGLYSVKIKRAQVTVKAIEQVARLERIRALRLMFVPVGDEIVAPLVKSEGLVRLVVISRDLTDNGERQLKARFNDRVECPRGALLGVRADTVEPWSIREVVPGSAADKAGLRVDDRVVKFNNQEITTFKELRALISKCSPGDSAALEVERGTGVLQLTVTFGEWD